MGLDFHISGGEDGYEGEHAHWSYGGFMKFRRHLARDIGIELGAMEGYRGLEPGNLGDVSWSTVKDDIKYLLDHSDCEGSIGPSRCGKIASRLRQLVDGWWKYDYDRMQALLLADMMEYCAQNNRRLLFC